MKTAIVILFLIICVSVVGGIIISQDDPVEKAKKAQDETLQPLAAEFIQATVVYYSEFTGLPWFAQKDMGEICAGNKFTLNTVSMSELEDCVKILVEKSSLRKEFFETRHIGSLLVTNPNPQTKNKLDTVVCFKPQSKFWQNDANTRYNKDGTDAPSNSCISQGGTTACYLCTQ